MSACERIEAANRSLARARSRLRGRSQREIVQRLGDVLERFRDPSSACREKLEADHPAETGFSPQTVRAGLDLGFDAWTGESLERLVAAELGSRSHALAIGGYERTSVLLAGSIPMPTVLSMLLPLVLRSPVLCKPASRDPVTPALFVETLRGIDPQLADCVAVVPFDSGDERAMRGFCASPCVCATGSDDTVEVVERLLSATQRRVLHGHRISLAVVDLAAAASRDAEALAVDVALWDQLGCLSPIAVLLVGGAEGAADGFAEQLADALARLESRWPRGAISSEAAAAIANERVDAQMRAALEQATRIFASSGTQWTVVLERGFQPRPAPLHRFVRLFHVVDRNALGASLASVAPHLAGVALVGFEAERDCIVEELLASGASRVCAAGRMQAPPLDWRRDNQPLLLGMARLANREVG